MPPLDIGHCPEVTEPRWPPDAFTVKPLYGRCRSMGGTSFLARSGEVVCWCVGHLYTHRTWKSRRRYATRRVFVTLMVRCRHRRCRHGGYGAAVAGRRWLSSMSSFCPIIRTPWRKVSPSCHIIPISRARRLPLASNNSGRILGCGPVSSRAYALVSSWSSRV